jgi:superfamily II DNA or RNA helicase
MQKISVRQMPDGQLHITPWVTGLEKIATCTVMKRTQDAQFQTVMVPEAVPLFYRSPRVDFGAICGGLTSRVLDYLQKTNTPYVYEDKRPPLPPLPESLQLPGLEYREGQEDAIRKILSSHCGIIKAATGYGKGTLIEALCYFAAHQGLRVVVSTNSRSVLRGLYERISKRCAGLRVTQCHGSAGFRADSHIVVCSAMSLHKVPDSWMTMLLFDEVHGAAGPKVSRELLSKNNSRVFGLSATPKGRSDGADLIAEALFGPVIVDIDYTQAESVGAVVPIYVWMVPVRGPQIGHKDPVALNRHGIWRNQVRNMRIVEAVRALWGGGFDSVLILVGTTEHALRLKALLPEIPVVYSRVSDEKLEFFKNQGIWQDHYPLCPDDSIIREDLLAGRCKGVIATMKWRDGVDLPSLKAVVRADGSSGPIAAVQIGGRGSRTHASKQIGVLIDFTDEFGPRMAARANRRVSHYKNEGWEVLPWEL